MFNNFEVTLISLIILTILIIFSLSWLVLKTLREGRKALTEKANINRKYQKKN
tara:strand:+ start:220 stop:378 length:159 start_codon:yes stop_codon:yes gene_type:complete